MMNIFTAFNEGYVLPTRVMLKSLIENQSDALTIYVFYSSLSQKSIDAIRQLEEPGRVSFVFTKVDDSFLGEFSIPEQFSKETYYRLFAHRIFPEDVEKALWLDGDIIVNGSLSDFYDQVFQGKLFIAIEDCDPSVAALRKTALKMPSDSKYVNSGVMLFNLKEMRKILNDQEIIQYLKENQEILIFADQDVFNGLLYEYFLIVDQNRWYNYSQWFITESNQAEVYSNARVIHYCALNKPWTENYSLIPSAIWWKYALITGPEYIPLFFETLCYKGELKKAQNELEERSAEVNRLQYDLDCVHASVSFHIGRALTFLPRKLRGGVRCYREHGPAYTVRRFLEHLTGKAQCL